MNCESLQSSKGITMKSQNSIKRIVISFSLAFAMALMTLIIQRWNQPETDQNQTLEAKIHPKSNFFLIK